MGTTEALRSSIRQAHDQMEEWLEAARDAEPRPDRPREGYERIDTFLAGTSKHLHAVDAVLLRPAQRGVDEGRALVHDYLHSAKQLEVVLAHVKAHEYGSVYETRFGWPEVWDTVEGALADQRRHEEELGDRLTESLDDVDVEQLAGRLHPAELAAPSRPHPYTPHGGVLGLIARKVMGTADRFWDTVEGRMVPEPRPKPKKPPGRIAQYFLGDPRFDEEDPDRPS